MCGELQPYLIGFTIGDTECISEGKTFLPNTSGKMSLQQVMFGRKVLLPLKIQRSFWMSNSGANISFCATH